MIIPWPQKKTLVDGPLYAKQWYETEAATVCLFHPQGFYYTD